MYLRGYTGVLTLHRPNCTVARRFLDFMSICYHSLASGNCATASIEVLQHSMSGFVSMTLSTTAGKEAQF